MVRVDDVVADLVVDVLRFAGDLDLFELLGRVGDGALLDCCEMLGLQIAVHEVDLL
jgi:hypothetical protein